MFLRELMKSEQSESVSVLRPPRTNSAIFLSVENATLQRSERMYNALLCESTALLKCALWKYFGTVSALCGGNWGGASVWVNE